MRGKRLVLLLNICYGTIDEEESDNKYLVIGFDRNANPIEVMYNVIDENTINVFHAMKLRKGLQHLIRTRGGDNARMTEEEAFALDEKWTKITPKVGPNGSGFLAKRRAEALRTEGLQTAHMITIDGLSANYLFSKAIATHKTPAEIVSEMVMERLAIAQ